MCFSWLFCLASLIFLPSCSFVKVYSFPLWVFCRVFKPLKCIYSGWIHCSLMLVIRSHLVVTLMIICMLWGVCIRYKITAWFHNAEGTNNKWYPETVKSKGRRRDIKCEFLHEKHIVILNDSSVTEESKRSSVSQEAFLNSRAVTVNRAKTLCLVYGFFGQQKQRQLHLLNIWLASSRKRKLQQPHPAPQMFTSAT